MKLILFLIFSPLVAKAGPNDANLYSKGDPGIVSVEAQELDKLVIGSSKPWMVQFYSSWCGHCRHFQPIFSEFGVRVEGWTEDVMGLAVINCASERNTQTCRDYDIMGYPTIKVFSAGAAKGDRGAPLQPTPHDVPSLESAYISWVLEQQSQGRPPIKPDLTLINRTITDLKAGLFIMEQPGSEQSYSAAEVILDLHAVTKNMPHMMSLSRLDLSFNADGIRKAGQVVALPSNQVLGEPKTAKELSNMALAHYNKLHPESPLASLKFVKRAQNVILKPTASTVAKPKVEASADEVKRRRYTVFLRDAETALVYALSHEVGQRKVIGGKSLTTLKQLLRVLRLYYPANQEKTHRLLQKLDDWVNLHDDAVKGSEFGEQVAKLNGGSHEGAEYIGCKGSSSHYGGYPCGLWTLWHLLTVGRYVNHPKSKSPIEDQEVLRAMFNYVDDFFGCRDCARHFVTMAENGQAITRDVQSSQEAVLWLWKAHNRVNVRLKGDISDDPVFPKTVFPDKQNCPACYNAKVGGYNLDVEFFKLNVRDFLVDMFHTNLNYSGTQFTVDIGGGGGGDGGHPDNKNLPAIKEDEVDDRNFMADPLAHPKDHVRKNSDFRQNSREVSSVWFWSMADISLCFAIYAGSTILVLVICYKFCSRRRLTKIVNGLFKDDNPRHDPGKMV